MKKNIFKGAKFGDRFLTEYNQLAIYVNKNIVNNYHGLLLNPGGTIYVDDSGKSISFGVTGYATHEIDIVSKYQDPIDEEKLDELSHDFVHSISIEYHFGENIPNYDEKRDIFKKYYRKAKEV